MPGYNEDMLGALFMVACLHPFKDVTEAHGYYIVAFEDTTATIMIDAKLVTLTEIHMTIDEANAKD